MGSYLCEDCGFDTQYFRDIKEHRCSKRYVQPHNPNAVKLPIRCRYSGCGNGKTYSTVGLRKRHEVIHDTTVPKPRCRACGDSLSREDSVNRHFMDSCPENSDSKINTKGKRRRKGKGKGKGKGKEAAALSTQGNAASSSGLKAHRFLPPLAEDSTKPLRSGISISPEATGSSRGLSAIATSQGFIPQSPPPRISGQRRAVRHHPYLYAPQHHPHIHAPSTPTSHTIDFMPQAAAAPPYPTHHAQWPGWGQPNLTLNTGTLHPYGILNTAQSYQAAGAQSHQPFELFGIMGDMQAAWTDPAPANAWPAWTHPQTYPPSSDEAALAWVPAPLSEHQFDAPVFGAATLPGNEDRRACLLPASGTPPTQPGQDSYKLAEASFPESLKHYTYLNDED